MSEERPSLVARGLPGDAWRATFVTVTFLGLAAALWAGPWTFVDPGPEPPAVPDWASDPNTLLRPNLMPVAHFGNRTYACSACHSKYRTDTEQNPRPYMHEQIVLEHGMNSRCLNCHNYMNRDVLEDDAGNEIAYDEPQLLCRKCHGEVYRDWINGAHGRTDGYWNADFGPQHRHVCDECHDPHRPHFPPLRPAPPPHTLRMGRQDYEPHEAAIKNPLQVFQREAAAHAVPAHARPGDSEREEAP